MDERSEKDITTVIKQASLKKDFDLDGFKYKLYQKLCLYKAILDNDLKFTCH